MSSEASGRLSSALWRGVRGRCPHCGEGALFRRWVKMNDSCSVCGLKLVRNQGDPWAFLLFLDRAFLLILIVIIYFKLLPSTLIGVVLLFAALILLFVASMPHRYGICLALDYYTRVRWRDPSDHLPPLE